MSGLPPLLQAWLVVALMLSVWVARRLRAQGGHV